MKECGLASSTQTPLCRAAVQEGGHESATRHYNSDGHNLDNGRRSSFTLCSPVIQMSPVMHIRGGPLVESRQQQLLKYEAHGH